MDKHYFDVDIASQYGVDCAIILQNLVHWIAKNIADNRNYYDGRYWTYSTAKALSTIHPYYSERQIRHIIQKLTDYNLIVVGCYNTLKYDRTAWYSVNNIEQYLSNAFNENVKSDLQKSKMELTEMSNESDKKVITIPDIETNIKTNIKTNNKSNVKLFSQEAENLAQHFKKLHPNINPKDGAWEKEFDDILRIDKRDYSEVKLICDEMAKDRFWANNFLSPAKLRKRNNEGILYYDVFLAKVKPMIKPQVADYEIDLNYLETLAQQQRKPIVQNDEPEYSDEYLAEQAKYEITSDGYNTFRKLKPEYQNGRE